MRNRPSLAEILSDDAGNIREEIADFLMEPGAALPEAGFRRRPGLGLIILSLILALALLAFNHWKDVNPPISPHKTPKIAEDHKQASPPVPFIQKKDSKQVAQDAVPSTSDTKDLSKDFYQIQDEDPFRDVDVQWGWFRAIRSDRFVEHLIGAYLVPKNSVARLCRLAISKNGQTKLLVRETWDDPSYYEVIWPEGQTTRILKSEVTLYWLGFSSENGG